MRGAWAANRPRGYGWGRRRQAQRSAIRVPEESLAAARASSPVRVRSTRETWAAAFITFIGLVLTVALIAGPERAERARQILTELLSFVTGLVAILRLAPRQAPHARSTHEAPE